MNFRRVAVLVAGLWWGAVSGISFGVVPALFAKLGPSVAGPLAAWLFSMQAWGSLVFGLFLLMILRRQRNWAVRGAGSSAAGSEAMAGLSATLATMGCVVLAMLFALVQELAVAQNIVSARANGANLRLWHSLGSGLVLGQWLCAAAVLWRLSGRTDRG